MITRGGVVALAAGIILAGCTAGSNYRPPQMAMPAAFSDPYAAIKSAFEEAPAKPVAKSRNAGEAPIELGRWWQALRDPRLDALVERAIKGNLDLQVALARLQEARTEEKVVLGLSLPAVTTAGAAAKGTGTDVTRGRVPSDLTSGDNRTGLTQINEIAGFDANWELDLWGKYRRELEAARDDRQTAAAARNGVLIAVVGDTVRAYLDLRGLQTQLAILKQNIDTETHSRDVIRERFDRGLTNELDLTLAARELASLRAAAAPLAAQIAAARNTIAILVGEMPQSLDGELSAAAAIPSLPIKIAPGLPLELLHRRPDIREAERRLAGATARIGVATADLFPHVVLSGAAGIQGQGLGVGPAASASIWSLGPSAYWNILDFGTLDALVDVADLRAQEQLAAYKSTVFDAVKEVDNAIGDYAAQQERLKNLSDALAAAQRASDLAQARYDRGLTDYLNVLDAERQQYGLETQYAVAEQRGADDFAVLYKALGGGWEQYQSLPPIRTPQPAIVAAIQRSFGTNTPPN